MEDEPSLLPSTPQPPAKWRGNFSVVVAGATSDQVWPFLSDFCSFDKWMPGIDVCRLVEGIPGNPGLTRYCAANKTAPDGTETTLWANERLLEIDPAEKFLTYKVVENNIGFKNYVATLRAIPTEGGCGIEWGFICDPADGWSEEDLKSYIDHSLKHIGKKMEDELALAA
ncbi:hypothetical protein MLD38_007027 [Melastoma candidum]|uniref:Uncharacterized protein n=1 Tax=Melastoma candidum TaxID=119954 RepID=A0ACB9RPX0_9MYRT|nr:hypothetical protein MLD38_007027 [Melastoma candidum]